MVHPTDELRRHTERLCTWKCNSRRGTPTRRPKHLSSFSHLKVRTCSTGVEQTVHPSTGFENEKCSIKSYPNKRCAHRQADWQRDIDPVSLRGWVNEVGNNPWWRLQAWPEEQSLCCGCHRLRCRIGHGEFRGYTVALVRDRRVGRWS